MIARVHTITTPIPNLVKLVLVAVKVSDVSVPLPVSSHHHLPAALAIKEVV